MGVLGILGGMGPAATELLYRRIIDKTNAQCDQDHLDMIILNHASIPDRTKAIKSGRTKELTEILCSDAKKLCDMGADFIAIPCNTSHYFYDEIQKASSVPVINMVRETIAELKKNKKQRICVLATDGTIMAGVYEKECKRAGIEYVAPDAVGQRIVMSIIYDQIKKGFPGNMEEFQYIHHYIKNKGCDGAVLACTELSVFGAESNLSSFYTDALDVLCEKSIIMCGKSVKEIV